MLPAPPLPRVAATTEMPGPPGFVFTLHFLGEAQQGTPRGLPRRVSRRLGLEAAWKHYQTILVSDGGGKMQAEAEPKGDWARHALRINDIIDNQVRSLRKRQLIVQREGARRDVLGRPVSRRRLWPARIRCHAHQKGRSSSPTPKHA